MRSPTLYTTTTSLHHRLPQFPSPLACSMTQPAPPAVAPKRCFPAALLRTFPAFFPLKLVARATTTRPAAHPLPPAYRRIPPRALHCVAYARRFPATPHFALYPHPMRFRSVSSPLLRPHERLDMNRCAGTPHVPGRLVTGYVAGRHLPTCTPAALRGTCGTSAALAQTPSESRKCNSAPVPSSTGGMAILYVWQRQSWYTTAGHCSIYLLRTPVLARTFGILVPTHLLCPPRAVRVP